MTFVDDEEIDKKELAELFLLMTRLELDKDSRFMIRAYITDISIENIQSIEGLLEIIKSNSEASHYQSLMISLELYGGIMKQLMILLMEIQILKLLDFYIKIGVS